MIIRLLLSAAVVCSFAIAQAPLQDRKGCADSKILSRLPGCVITSCRTSEFDIGIFRVALRPTEKKEGEYEKIEFRCAREDSAVKLSRNAEGALTQAGFTTKYKLEESGRAFYTAQKGGIWVEVDSLNGFYSVMSVRTQALKQEMQANAAGWAQEIEQTGRASIYGINFDTAKSTIRPDSEKVLTEVLTLLQKNPAWRLAVAGHTDNVGANEMNLALSRSRAESVATWLTTHGVAKDRLLPGGFGSLAPVADNNSEDGRAKNRRVDLIKLY